MHAMQYTITLPADYDMDVIRRRVAAKGSLLDDFPDLGLKAYLIRERGREGSPVNEYAPFYLWNGTAGLGRFLWGGSGFGGIVADFGRPTVRHWIGAAATAGPEPAGGPPRTAVRRTGTVPDGADPAESMARAEAELSALAGTPGLHSAAVALDPHHWELVHFSLWAGTAPTDLPGDRYQVLHLSAPGLAELTLADRTAGATR
ncbi:DUF4865 family protein [Streptacidiphilus sp. N1-10]|uniref:DUF4865 family protein n=1 Tax=Streptacidiphilus jeojiensis TaxID=3229225 RepID=A0ABV6XLD4_9ACTN